MDWKHIVVALLLMVILYNLMNKKKSGFSETRAKLTGEKCPAGFRELGPTICVKD